MLTKRLVPVLLAVGMLTALPAAAEETEEIAIYPTCQTTLFYSSGTLQIHLDSSFSYSTVSVYRSLQEGQFLYYQYAAELAQPSCLYFPLIEGDYIVLLTVPTDDAAGQQTFSFSCTMRDPDMDETLSFDSSCHEIYLSCDPEARADVTASWSDGVQDRVYMTATEFTMAGRGFTLGDVNHDDTVDAADAAILLADAARMGSGGASTFSAIRLREADVSLDGSHNAVDAAYILSYSASFASGVFTGTMEEYVRK